MNKIIYADHAATTQLDDDAFNAMLPYMKNEFSNPSQPYSFSRKSKKALQEARENIARCINAQPYEIYFTSGGTESDNWAIKSALFQKIRRKIVTSNIEHHAILNSCKSIQTLYNYDIDYVLVSSKGYIDPDKIDEKLKEKDVYLTSVMMANNEIGTIQPIKELVNIAHKYGTIFHTDAVQAVGHIPVDVKDLNVDMLSASAHKFNGPKGIGFLYIKSGTNISSLINGGSQEYGLRAGTENVAAIVGMSTALQKNCNNIYNNTLKLFSLEKELLARLKESKLNFMYNSGEKHIPGNLSISFKSVSGEMLLHRLDLKGIMVSTGSACDSKNIQISHVIKAIGLNNDYAKGTIRISLGNDNSIEDIYKIASALIEIVPLISK